MKCDNCGGEILPNEKYCAFCGHKIETVESVDAKKKILTDETIKRDMLGLVNPRENYIIQYVLLGIIVVSSIWKPVFLIYLLPWSIGMIEAIMSDSRKKKQKYMLIESPCIKKDTYEDDDTPLTYLLWFPYFQKDKMYSLRVEQEYFNSTQIGEEFYLVFAIGEEEPCLWYKKSEWMM